MHSSLRTHLKTHNGEKSNKCNKCNFASSRADVLRTHLKTHSGEKPNKCTQCDYASSLAGNLRNHLKTHTGEKSNQCSQVHHFSLTLTASSTRWPPCRLVRVQPIENPSQPLPSQLLVTVDFFLKFLKFFLKYFGSTLTSTASSRWPPCRLVRVQPIENPSQHLSSQLFTQCFVFNGKFLTSIFFA